MDAWCGASKLRVKNIGAWNQKVGHPWFRLLIHFVKKIVWNFWLFVSHLGCRLQLQIIKWHQLCKLLQQNFLAGMQKTSGSFNIAEKLQINLINFKQKIKSNYYAKWVQFLAFASQMKTTVTFKKHKISKL